MSPSDNPPVLLLHGLATSANRTWRETGWIDLLQDEGRLVVAPDLPGHAVVDPPTDPDGYASFEADVWSHAPDEPFDAIGFSLGARTLLWLASEHPGRIRRLVVAGVGANLFRHDDTSDAEEMPDQIAHHFSELARSSGTDPRAVVALVNRPSPPLTLDRLGSIDAEVLVVLGDADFAGPADPLMAALPGARLVTLRGVDHFATPKSMKFLDAALGFLSS